MTVTVFEGYTVGPVERGITLPARRVSPLSTQKKALLKMNVGEFFELALVADGPSRLDIRRLLGWARRQNIGVVQRDIGGEVIRIQRIDGVTGAHDPSPDPGLADLDDAGE